MYFGNISAVAIYDFDALKEIYNLPEAAGRPSAFVYKNRMLGKNLGEFTQYLHFVSNQKSIIWWDFQCLVCSGEQKL